jgi:uncharacterized protein YecT (DUF1311 family)
MRALLLALASASAPGLAAAQPDCSTATTQIEMNVCASARWQHADAELNRLWKIVKPAADARGTGEALLQEQRAWLARRDAACEAERASHGGGSIAPLMYFSCMEEMTLARNAQLAAMR